ncbi:MAG: hypothetical protein J6R66_04520 [Clostridia bacterium]|nr:hypothetical protein [Clostridia bacterium]
MKKSTKMVVYIFVPPLVFILSILLMSYIGMDTSTITMIVGGINLLVIFFWIKGFAILFSPVTDIEKILRSLSNEGKTSFPKGKEIFLKHSEHLMKNEVAKEVFVGDVVAVITPDGKSYFACPFFCFEKFKDECIGIYIPARLVDILKNDEYAFMVYFSQLVHKEQLENYAVDFSEKNFDFIKSKIKKSENYNFEKYKEKLKEDKRYKMMGVGCMICGVLSFSFMGIGLVSAIFVACSVVLGVKSIRYFNRESIVDWKYGFLEAKSFLSSNSETIFGFVVSLLVALRLVCAGVGEIYYNLCGQYQTVTYVQTPERTEVGFCAYTTDLEYTKGEVDGTSYDNDFMNINGTVPDGYEWGVQADFENKIKIDDSVDFEAGIQGNNTENFVCVFTLQVENDTDIKECVEILKDYNVGFTLDEKSLEESKSIYFIEHIPNDITSDQTENYDYYPPEAPAEQEYYQYIPADIEKYLTFFFKNEEGVRREYAIKKVNDRVICIVRQSVLGYPYDDFELEHIFYE